MNDKLGVFNSYSRYYDLLYRDKDYAAETGYIQSLLTRYGIDKGDLLELGSGTGKHGRLLAARGYTVHGIERSAEMLAMADLIPGFTCQQGDITSININKAFDAVLALFHVISYQTANNELRSVFSNVSRHLKAGRVFLFDFWYTPAVYSQKPVVRVKQMHDEQVEITRIAEPVVYPNENRVDVNYTVFVRHRCDDRVEILRETHSMRHFSLPEIHMIADIHGFELLAAEEFATGKIPDETTWSVCVILKKR